jgi:hypothetical protein
MYITVHYIRILIIYVTPDDDHIAIETCSMELPYSFDMVVRLLTRNLEEWTWTGFNRTKCQKTCILYWIIVLFIG